MSKAQYYIKLDTTHHALFVGPFDDRNAASAATDAHMERFGYTAEAGFIPRGIMTTTEARVHGLRRATLLGKQMPESSAEFFELIAYATMLA